MKKLALKNWTLTDNIIEIPANVPGDVTNDLYLAGKIPDPLFAKNLESLQDIYEKDWTYTCTFDFTENIDGQKVVLTFEGIDTLSEITLNGNFLGKTDNMFLKYTFDITEKIMAGKNTLSVKILSATKYIREKNDGTNYRALFTQDRLYIRKAQCHWGWDWAPKLPGIGLWLPVSIDIYDGAKIENVKVMPYLSGDVSLLVETKEINENCTIEAVVDGTTKRIKATEGINIINFKVQNPKWWYPLGYGEQPLYEYTVKILQNGIETDVKNGRFAFCETKTEERPYGENEISFAVIVNGQKVFCKGSNWVPLSNMTGAIADEKYREMLTAAKDGGFNMLRVWGGGVYEKDIFYNLCDELGIMIWQDFMFSCSAIPTEIDGIEENFLAEAKYQIQRLQNHACLTLWCGGNEFMPKNCVRVYEKGNQFVREKLAGVCAYFDARHPYIYNSPFGRGNDEWDITTGDAHISCAEEVLSHSDIQNYEKYIAERPAFFISESAHLGPTKMNDLRKFIPENEIETYGESWDYHFVDNPYAIIPETFLSKEKRLAQGMYGDITSAGDFVKKAMLVHAEFMRAEIDFARFTEKCSGFLNWMYNDNWGCGTWSVIDYYGFKKPVYYAMKRAYRPVNVSFIRSTEGDLSAVAYNDTLESIEGTFTVYEKTFDGEILQENTTPVHIEKGNIFQMPCNFTREHYATAILRTTAGEIKTIYPLHVYAPSFFTNNLTYSAEKPTANTIKLTLNAKSFAKCVYIDIVGEPQTVYEDNFFDMEKGETRTILIKTSKNPEDICVKTFADEWEN